MRFLHFSGRAFGLRTLTVRQAYGFATLVTAATLGVALVVDGPLEGKPALVIFTLPIMLSAYMGGLRAGLLATGLSFLLPCYYLLPPVYSFAVGSTVAQWQLFLVTLSGVVISVLNEALHRARRHAGIAIREHQEAELDRNRFFTLSQDVLCILGFDGFFKDVNPAWEKTLGFTKPELLATPFIEFVHPDDRVATLAEAEKVSGGRSLMAFENRYRCKDGSYRLFQWSVTPVVADRVMYGVARDITERKQTEAALREKEAQLHASDRRLAEIVQGMTEACFTLDAEWRFTFVNDRCETQFHRTREEVLGRSIWELFPQLLGTPMEAHYRLAMTERVPVSVESFSPVAERWLDIRLFPTGDGLAAFLLDVHPRRQAEEARRTSEARYRTLFECAPDGIVIADPNGVYLDANGSICEMLGYTCAELIGLPSSRIVAETEFEHIAPALNAIHTKSPYHREWEFRRNNGSTFDAEVIATKLPDGNVLAMIRDVTDRKRTEQALRESEERFRFLNNLAEATRTLADPAQIMAVMARMLGEHLRASRCAYADVEKDGEQFTILHDYTDGCTSTVGNYQLSLFGTRAVATLHGGQTLIIRNVETELLAGDGADMFNAIGIKAIITCPLVKEGRLRALMALHQTTPRDWQPGEIAIVQDVVERCWATIERRTAEEKIHQLNAELEQRVTERTAQLEAANKELEAFSYSVSHDLRAPLRGVNGYVRMLKEDCAGRLDAEGNRLLAVVSSEAKRMGQLIDDLLSFSRLGREQMGRTAIDMTALANAAFENLARTSPEAAPNFELKSLPQAQGDLSMLRQVFANLIGNAAKFTRHQPAPVVEVGGSNGEGEMTYYVKDNGVGFDEKYSHKLFGVFQRLHSEAEFEGTGVGLALVQRVIQRHGGRVWAEGKPNQGATFYFTLPMRKDHPNE